MVISQPDGLSTPDVSVRIEVIVQKPGVLSQWYYLRLDQSVIHQIRYG